MSTIPSISNPNPAPVAGQQAAASVAAARAPMQASSLSSGGGIAPTFSCAACCK